MSVSEIDVLDAGRAERNVTLHGAAILAALVAGVRRVVADSAGTLFDPDSGAHTYGLNATGSVVTDTCVLDAVTRVKTYTRDSLDRVTAESQWVPQ